MSVAVEARMTAGEYLAWVATRPAGERYELVDGEVVAMAPQRNRHLIVKSRAYRALDRAIEAGRLGCVAVGDGATVVVDDATVFEPDALVQCGTPLDLDAVTADAPTIVVEVISPGSQVVDTNRKLQGYFRLDSVRHYLVLDPVRKTVLHYFRDGAGGISTAQLSSGRLLLQPPGLVIPVADFFSGL
jgi:Uma2 family endonuclease